MSVVEAGVRPHNTTSRPFGEIEVREYLQEHLNRFPHETYLGFLQKTKLEYISQDDFNKVKGVPPKPVEPVLDLAEPKSSEPEPLGEPDMPKAGPRGSADSVACYQSLKAIAAQGTELPTYKEWIEKHPKSKINRGTFQMNKTKVERETGVKKGPTMPKGVKKTAPKLDTTYVQIIHTHKGEMEDKALKAAGDLYLPLITKLLPPGQRLSVRRFSDPKEIEFRLESVEVK